VEQAGDYNAHSRWCTGSGFPGVALLWVLPPTIHHVVVFRGWPFCGCCRRLFITFRTAHTPPGGSPPVQHVEAAALYAAAGLRDGWDPSRGGAPFTRGQVIIGSFRRGWEAAGRKSGAVSAPPPAFCCSRSPYCWKRCIGCSAVVLPGHVLALWPAAFLWRGERLGAVYLWVQVIRLRR
jgi:hypothetical protein